MKRRMTVLDRRKLRDAVLERELGKARRRAAEYALSPECVSAMRVTHSDVAAAREFHSRCQGEELGGQGCLCTCHDCITGDVTTGFAEPISADEL